MPNPKGTPGDLYAEVKIMVPPRLSPRERELFAALADESGFDPRNASTRAGAESHDESGRKARS
jgi:curved DNA-binding protein